jgi:hypothetical protein
MDWVIMTFYIRKTGGDGTIQLRLCRPAAGGFDATMMLLVNNAMTSGANPAKVWLLIFLT